MNRPPCSPLRNELLASNAAASDAGHRAHYEYAYQLDCYPGELCPNFASANLDRPADQEPIQARTWSPLEPVRAGAPLLPPIDRYLAPPALVRPTSQYPIMRMGSPSEAPLRCCPVRLSPSPSADSPSPIKAGCSSHSRRRRWFNRQPSGGIWPK